MGSDLEAMLAVEKARHNEPTAPSEFPLPCCHQDDRLDRHCRATRRAYPGAQPCTLFRATLDLGDERIPIRIGGEVSQDLPHAAPRRGNVDLRLDDPHASAA